MNMKSILFASMIVSFTACGDAASDTKEAPAAAAEEKKAEEPALTTTAANLMKEYEDNEVAADNKYKGKKVTISGKVTTIGKDITDDAYVTLGTGDDMEITSVQLYFSDNSQLASLKKGQQLTVVGEVDGKMGNVLVKECVIK